MRNVVGVQHGCMAERVCYRSGLLLCCCGARLLPLLLPASSFLLPFAFFFGWRIKLKIYLFWEINKFARKRFTVLYKILNLFWITILSLGRIPLPHVHTRMQEASAADATPWLSYQRAFTANYYAIKHNSPSLLATTSLLPRATPCTSVHLRIIYEFKLSYYVLRVK